MERLKYQSNFWRNLISAAVPQFLILYSKLITPQRLY
ncbi:MAG: hypothetical protein ACI920_003620, partial [Saprospiraceae bacterium]